MPDQNIFKVIFVLLVGLVAVIYDLKYRKIPNWLTFGSIAAGVMINLFVAFRNWPLPLLGILVGFTALFIPFALRGIGAGDVKLLMAFGSIFGPWITLWIALWSGIAGGVLSLLQIFYSFGWAKGCFRLYLTVSALWNKAQREILNNLKPESKLYIPYGLAIFIGLIVVLIIQNLTIENEGGHG